jgi:hypothetical protein
MIALTLSTTSSRIALETFPFFSAFRTCRFSPLTVLGKVGVANGIVRIPHLHIRLGGQGPAVGETLHQVGVGDDRPAEGDHVRKAPLYRGLGRLLRVAAVADERAVELFPGAVPQGQFPGQYIK